MYDDPSASSAQAQSSPEPAPAGALVADRRPTAAARVALGIDVSRDRLDAVLRWIDPSPEANAAGARRPLGSRKVYNSSQGIGALLSWSVSRARCDLGELRVVAEATAGYHLQLARIAHARGCDVVIANPRRVHQYGRAIGRLTKSDLVDADTLARFGALEPRFHWQPPPPAIQELDALIRRRQALHRAARREEARLQMTPPEDSRRPPLIGRSIDSAIRFHADAIEEITTGLDALFQRFPQLARERQLLLSIPGVGDETANVLLYLLRSKAFTCAREPAALCGLVPIHHHSGTDCDSPGRTSTQYDRRYRAALHLPTRVAIRHNPQLRALYERQLAAGKNFRQATLAVMHKLVRIAFGVLRNQKTYVASWEQLTASERTNLPLVYVRKKRVQTNARRLTRLRRAARTPEFVETDGPS